MAIGKAASLSTVLLRFVLTWVASKEVALARLVAVVHIAMRSVVLCLFLHAYPTMTFVDGCYPCGLPFSVWIGGGC